VRLVTAPWIAVRIAGVVAPGLRRDHPGIELRLVATRPDWPPPPGDATLSLWCETPPQPGDFAIQFGEVVYAMYGAPGTSPDAPATLAHAFDDGGPRTLPRWATAQNAPDRWAQARLRPGSAFALTATDSLVLREAARAGLGAALLPVCLAEDDPGLVRLDPSGPVLRRPLMLHAHPDTVQFARVQVVIDALRRAAAALFGAAA
jgi:DNA-binding transcriptional LysR family regulator